MMGASGVKKTDSTSVFLCLRKTYARFTLKMTNQKLVYKSLSYGCFSMEIQNLHTCYPQFLDHCGFFLDRDWWQ